MELDLNPGLCFCKPQHKTDLKRVGNGFGLKFTGYCSFVGHPDLSDFSPGHSLYVPEIMILHPHQKSRFLWITTPNILIFHTPVLWKYIPVPLGALDLGAISEPRVPNNDFMLHKLEKKPNPQKSFCFKCFLSAPRKVPLFFRLWSEIWIFWDAFPALLDEQGVVLNPEHPKFPASPGADAQFVWALTHSHFWSKSERAEPLWSCLDFVPLCVGMIEHHYHVEFVKYSTGQERELLQLQLGDTPRYSKAHI